MKLEFTATRLARFVVRHAGWTLGCAALLAALGLAIAAERLELRTSNLDLIDPKLPPVAHFLDFVEAFGTPNQLVVVLQGEDPQALATAVDRLGPRLRVAAGVEAVLDKKPIDTDALEILGIDPYFTSRDRGMFLVFVQPEDRRSEATRLAPFVAAVEQAVTEAEVESLGVRVGLTGMPRYAIDDRDVISHDMSRLSGVALVAVLALFVAGFGNLRRPLAAVAVLLIAIGWTLGVVAIVVGHLTLLSSFFAAILAGLGVDYGIHLVDRIQERVGDGDPLRQAVPEAVGDLVRPLATSALTTASVLFAMVLSGFRGFAELGVVAGIGVLACLISMLFVLPALLVHAGSAEPRVAHDRRQLGRLLVRVQSRPVAFVLGAAALCGALLGPAPFDSDYLDLQPRGSEAVRLERAMVARSDLSPMFAVFVADDLERVKELTWALADDETVGSVRSVQSLGGVGGLVRAGASAATLAGLRSDDGRYAVYAFPAGDIWRPEEQARFLAHMRSIDPAVTGMPVLGSFMVARSKRALTITLTLGAALLGLWVLAGMRRLLPAFLALVPTVLTGLSLHALMRLAGVAWNPLDVMALPIVLGIAVDDGVHLVHRFRAEQGDLARTLIGTGRSVVLTSATTLAAFGALVLTDHRGLASFAMVIVLGVSAALLLSVLVLPQMLVACSRLKVGSQPLI